MVPVHFASTASQLQLHLSHLHHQKGLLLQFLGTPNDPSTRFTPITSCIVKMKELPPSLNTSKDLNSGVIYSEPLFMSVNIKLSLQATIEAA